MENMHTYIISDVWMALKLSSRNFFIWLLVIWGPYFFILSNISNNAAPSEVVVTGSYICTAVTLAILIQSIVIYFANRKYIVDMETGLITFPRSDIENNILAILLLYPYWNLMRTETVHASDIENLYLDTKRWDTKHKVTSGATVGGKTKYRAKTKKHVRYTINIAGIFGSANLTFLGRQKRDETRNAIQQCVKYHSGKSVDRKVTELG